MLWWLWDYRMATTTTVKQLSSSNLWLQHSDKSHNSEIPHFWDFILHSCQARPCGVPMSVQSSFDGHSAFKSLKYFTFDYGWQSFSMQMYSHAYSRNWSMLICPLAICKTVNMKMWFQMSPRTRSDTESTSDQEYVSTSVQVLLTDQVLPARIVRSSDSPRAQGNYL
jgi:hypothetical protein